MAMAAAEVMLIIVPGRVGPRSLRKDWVIRRVPLKFTSCMFVSELLQILVGLDLRQHSRSHQDRYLQ